jgi:23S rRNA (uridine2552-2'-O)-methyltransferase
VTTKKSGRGARELKVRVKDKRKSQSSRTWLERQLNDPYVIRAKREGFRSRAAFKLIEIADKDRLFRPGMSVVDLGAAPGSWTQVLRERLGPNAAIVGIDLLPMEPIAGVTAVQADFREPEGLAALEKALDGRKVDLVVCDLSPNLSGVEAADQARAVHLGELALEFARVWLQPGGDMVVKAFQGEGFVGLRRALEAHFTKVYVRKPKASRDRSREVYLVGKALKV